MEGRCCLHGVGFSHSLFRLPYLVLIPSHPWDFGFSGKERVVRVCVEILVMIWIMEFCNSDCDLLERKGEMVRSGGIQMVGVL